jgi:hypothetical protein
VNTFKNGYRNISVNTLKPWYRNICVNTLTLILLTWRIWWAPDNASKWQMGFNSMFKGLKLGYRTTSVHTLKPENGTLVWTHLNVDTGTLVWTHLNVDTGTLVWTHLNLDIKTLVWTQQNMDRGTSRVKTTNKSWISHSLNLHSPRFDTGFYQPHNTTIRDIKYPAMQACAIYTIPPFHIQFALETGVLLGTWTTVRFHL